MKYFPFLFTLIFIACSKQDVEENANCDLTGTWRQVLSIPGDQEIRSTSMDFPKNGDMKFGGITGFRWRVKGDCSVFEYWRKTDNNITVKMKILAFDGEYLSLQSLGGALGNPQLDPLGFLGTVKFKRVN